MSPSAERVVLRAVELQEAARLLGVGEAAPDERGGRHPRQAERARAGASTASSGAGAMAMRGSTAPTG